MNKDTLNRACLEKAIVDHLKDAHEESRDQLREQLDAGDRITTDLGTAYVTNPKPRWVVTDEQALFDWVEANLPDEIITERKVNPALKDAMLKAGGVTLEGQVIYADGLGQASGSPTLTVKPSERARLSAPMLVAGALEPPTELGFPELEAS